MVSFCVLGWTSAESPDGLPPSHPGLTDPTPETPGCM